MAGFLFAHWEGGGNTPPMLAVVRRLVARGHSVRVMSDPCNREDVAPTGASFASWTRAPRRFDKSAESDLLHDWEVSAPPALIGRLRDRIFVGPSLGYAQDVFEELREFPADVVVSSEMLLGAMAGAEAAGVPCIGLSANVYLFPRPGVPPFGPGFLPARNALERGRDLLVRSVARHLFGKGTRTFNETRRALGLGPIRHPFEQVDRLARQVVLTSAAFDFQSPASPATLVYAGPELEDPAWTASWESPWPDGDPRPLVIVGFSTTFQNQHDVLRKVIAALGALDVRAVVTAGPAMDVASLPAPRNVHVCASAPHSRLLLEASAMVTHCGHGTVIRTLAAGVPLVCLPMGRDQNENAARVVYHGAGVRLAPSASPEKIRTAVGQVLESPTFREKARVLGNLIVRDARDSRAVSILEDVALTSSRASGRVRRQIAG